MSETEFEYQWNPKVSKGEVEAELASFWAEAAKDPELQNEMRAKAIDVSQALAHKDEIVVRKEGSGIDPLTLSLIVKIAAPVVGKMLADIWTYFVRPRIDAKYGKDSLKPKSSKRK